MLRASKYRRKEKDHSTKKTTEGHYFLAKVAGLATMKKMAMVDEVAKRLMVVYPGEH